MDEKIITGWWDGEPIWRWKTPEEKLISAGISVEVANLGAVFLGNKDLAKALPVIDF